MNAIPGPRPYVQASLSSEYISHGLDYTFIWEGEGNCRTDGSILLTPVELERVSHGS